MNTEPVLNENSSIIKFLQETSISNILPEKRIQILELDSNTTVSQAIKALAQNEILSMPVWNKADGFYLGFLDYLDILSFAINMYIEGNQVSETQYGAYCTDISILRHRGVRFGMKPVKEIINVSKKDQFIPVYAHGSVYQLIEGVFYKGIHRVPVMDENNKIISIVTQSDMLNFLTKQMEILVKDLGNITINQLDLGTKNVITMSANAQAIHAFYLMYAHKVSAVAIVNSLGSMIANLSASDIRGLEQQHFESLLLPVTQYISNQMGKVKAPITCSLNTDFQTVLLKMSLFRIHRIWIVDENDKPIGVISQTDVMKKLSEFQDPKNFKEESKWSKYCPSK